MRRYDRELSLEIDRTVRRFNDKIKRLQKEERNLELPEPITRLDIVTSTAKKSTIEKKLKEYQKFLERGAEETITTTGGAKISRYELNQLKARQRSAKISLTREIQRLQKIHPKIAGQRQAGTFETIGDFYYTERMATRKALNKNIESLNNDQLKKHKEIINKAIKNKDKDLTLKQNYMDILDKLAYDFGIDKRKLDVIKKELNKLSPSDFVRLFNEDQAIKAMVEYYDEIIKIRRGQSKVSYDYLQDTGSDLFDLLYNNIEETIEDYV